MSEKYLLSKTTAKDLREIGSYTQKNWGKEQVKKYLRLIYDKFNFICDNPKIGIDAFDVYPNLRSVPVESHIVYYFYKNDMVYIVSILHKNMDPALIDWKNII